MSQNGPRLVLIPGLGADHRIFIKQRAAFPDLATIERLEPEGQESLPAHAARLAARFEKPDRPYVLGGSSMGGMLALEMARLLRPAALVLIASARSGREVRPWLRAMQRCAGPLPGALIDAGRIFEPLLAPAFSSTGPEHRELFLKMLRDTPTRYIRWASRAILAWEATGPPDCPVYRIHGGADHIIRPPSDEGIVIPGAGHLVNLSHAERVNAMLREALDSNAR